MIFVFGALLGGLLGVVLGQALCIRYMRREMTADIGPRLRSIENQLDMLESAVNLAIMSRYADLSGRSQ